MSSRYLTIIGYLIVLAAGVILPVEAARTARHGHCASLHGAARSPI
jgi:hypothetical protein